MHYNDFHAIGFLTGNALMVRTVAGTFYGIFSRATESAISHPSVAAANGMTTMPYHMQFTSVVLSEPGTASPLIIALEHIVAVRRATPEEMRSGD